MLITDRNEDNAGAEETVYITMFTVWFSFLSEKADELYNYRISYLFSILLPILTEIVVRRKGVSWSSLRFGILKILIPSATLGELHQGKF